MNENRIVFSKESKLYMDTAITQSAFSKSRVSQRLGEQGFEAVFSNGEWNFEPWSFSGTQSSLAITGGNGRETVLLEGEAFDGFTLKEKLEEESAESAEAGYLVISAMEAAMSKGVNLKANGGSGIFLNKDLNRVIFLPASLYENTIACFGDTIYSQYSGVFIQPNLSGTAALNFTQAVIAYRLLCKEFPFAQEDSAKRHEDCLDHNFVRLSGRIHGISDELASFVDNALQRSQKIESHKKSKSGKAKYQDKISREMTEHTASALKSNGDWHLKFPLQQLAQELGLEDNGRLPESGMLKEVNRSTNISLAQFEENSRKEYLAFQKKLKVKRWFRHHSTKVYAVAAAVVLVASFTVIYRHDNQKKPTSKGLSSTQTMEMFYSGYNTMDVIGVQNSSTGRTRSSHTDIVSNFYVAAKSQSAYSPKDKTVSPAEWMNYNHDGQYSIFGLTQFCIDGVPSRLYFQGPARNTRPAAVIEENGAPITEGQTVKHNVSYYMLYNHTPESMDVVRHDDTVTLAYKKHKWAITAIDVNTTEESIDLPEFIQDYNSALEEAKLVVGDNADSRAILLETGELLSKKYYWISTSQEILEALNYMEESYSFTE